MKVQADVQKALEPILLAPKQQEPIPRAAHAKNHVTFATDPLQPRRRGTRDLEQIWLIASFYMKCFEGMESCAQELSPSALQKTKPQMLGRLQKR